MLCGAPDDRRMIEGARMGMDSAEDAPENTAGAGRTTDPRRFVVPAADAGARLDLFLARHLEISRAQARRLLGRGAVRVDGRSLGEKDKGQALATGAEIVVEAFRPPSTWAPQPEPEGGAPPPVVLASGPGWLVVDKPAGMPVHPLNEGETGTVLNAVVAAHPEVQGVGEGGLRCGVVHRLDVWTSGALVMATEEATWQRLRAAFAEHRVAKRYLALVEGDFAAAQSGSGDEPMRMEIGLVMARHRPAKVRVARADELGGPSVRPISQTVRLVESYGDASLVEIVPKTGFLHQIRVTLAHLGHPVLGDRTYAPHPRRNNAGQTLADRCGAHRHMLHAAEVEISDVHAVAPLPADFERCRAWLTEHAPGAASAASLPPHEKGTM